MDDQKLDTIQTRKFRGLTRLRGEAKKEAKDEKRAQKTTGDASMDFDLAEISGNVGGGEGRKRARME